MYAPKSDSCVEVRRTRINQFVVESDFELPVERLADGPSPTEAERLVFRHCPAPLAEFPSVALVGRGPDYGFLRVYDVGSGVLLRAGELVRMFVHADGRGVDFDFDRDDGTAAALAGTFGINMAIALCTLLRGDLALHAGAVDVDGRIVGIMAPSGGGKSTLVWSLVNAGALFANDE